MYSSFLVVLLFALLAVDAISPLKQHLSQNFPQINKLTDDEVANLVKAVELDIVKQQQKPVAQPKNLILRDDCPTIPLPPPVDNVNQLKPGNIKVVMAMGDSITAGMGALDRSLLILREYRGLSWSIGGNQGDEAPVTIPNILKQYTGAPVIGFSEGIGERDNAKNGLNAAESGAIVQDMPGQAVWLVNALKANKNINMAEDWKMVTIWIGGNNLCDVCDDYDYNNEIAFNKHLRDALTILQENVPRLVVNLVPSLDVTSLANITEGTCGVLHLIECYCAASTDMADRELVRSVNKKYNEVIYQIAKEYSSKDYSSFAVVVQPFLIDSIIPDRSWLSIADCFHPNGVAHNQLGASLWNAIVTPLEEKKTSWVIGEEPICIDADTLIYTR